MRRRAISIRSVFLLQVLLGLGMLLHAPKLTAKSPAFYYSAETRDLRPLLNLDGRWTMEGNVLQQVPFDTTGLDAMKLRRDFDLVDYGNLPPKLYLYFEGLAWTAEVYLNDRLLVVSRDPFQPQLLPLQRAWLKPRGNRIVVHLRADGPAQPMYPRRFLGIFRQNYLLVKDSVRHPVPYPRLVAKASKAVVVAPWAPEAGFLHDTLAVAAALRGNFSYPYQHPVVFAFAPSSRSRGLLARQGITQLIDYKQADSLAFYSPFPLANAPLRFNVDFWRTASGQPSPSYGKYFGQAELHAPRLRGPDQVALLIFLLLPLLCMLLLKFIAPRIYSALPEHLTKTKIHLELIANSKFLKDEQRLAMNVMRMLLLSIVMALFLYYLDRTGTWYRLNVLASESVLYALYAGSDYSLYQLFWQVFAFVAGISILKYLFLNLFGTIYRYFSLGSMVQNLDIFAAFPLNLALLLPMAFIFFIDVGAGTVLLQVWYLLFLALFVRRIVLIFGGLTRLFQFSTSLKFLYICALEISPWVFLV